MPEPDSLTVANPANSPRFATVSAAPGTKARNVCRSVTRARRAGATIADGALLDAAVQVELHNGGELTIGTGAQVGAGTRFEITGGRVEIGANAVLGERCTLICRAAITIGDAAQLGDGVTLNDALPVYTDVERPIRAQGTTTAPISVGARATIGHGAALEAGATVAPGAAVPVRTVLGRP